jgi:hypothetical protein
MKNNIFTDPKCWAARTVGSPFRYRLTQSFTVVLGILLAIMLYLICREAHLPLYGYFAVLVILVMAAVELPLCYLRALRFYVVDRQVKP